MTPGRGARQLNALGLRRPRTSEPLDGCLGLDDLIVDLVEPLDRPLDDGRIWYPRVDLEALAALRRPAEQRLQRAQVVLGRGDLAVDVGMT